MTPRLARALSLGTTAILLAVAVYLAGVATGAAGALMAVLR